MRLVISLAGAFLLLQLTSQRAPGQVVSTSPGKKNVYASGNVTFSGSIADITATIAKGKGHTILEIDAMGRMIGCTGTHVGVSPIVNDSSPFDSMYVEPTGGGVFRSNAAVWWFDLDAAEALSPGRFIKQPINIILRANSGDCPDGATFSGTLRARLVKK